MPMLRASAVVFTCGLLAAQSPPAAPAPAVDLAAVAKAIAPATVPDLRARLPARALDQVADRLRDVEPARRAFLLGQPTSNSLARDLALATVEAALPTDADGLLTRARAARLLAKAAAASTFLRQASGREPNAERDWFEAIAEPAQAVADDAGARLLRDHPDTPAAARWLLLDLARLAARSGVAETALVAAAAARLPAPRPAADRLQLAAAALALLDLPTARSELAAAQQAPRPADPLQVAAMAELAATLSAQLAEVTAALTSDLPAAIRPLRALAIADPEAAFARADALVDAGTDHALPFTVQAIGRLHRADLPGADQSLQQAAARSGRERWYVFARIALDGMLAARERRTDWYGPAMLQAMQRLLPLLDGDRSTDATLFRWHLETLERQLAPGAPANAVPDSARLQREIPDDLATFHVTIANLVLRVRHGQLAPAAALAALAAPLPKALAQRPVVLRLRTRAWLYVDLLGGGGGEATTFDRLLAEQLAVTGDAADGAFLRGVRSWWQALRPGAPASLAKAALAAFDGAQQPFGAAGRWQAVVARAVVHQHVHGRTDLEGLADRFAEEVDDAAVPRRVALAAVLLASGEDGGPRFAERLLGMTDDPAVQRALLAAMADAHTDAGRQAQAAECARRWVSLPAATDRELPHDGGVLQFGEMRFHVGVDVRARFHTLLSIDFHVLPALPTRAELEAMALR